MRSTYLLAFLALAACSSTSTPTNPTPGNDAGTTDAKADAADGAPSDGGPVCGKECDGFAVESFFAGESNRNFEVGSTAWKEYGDDIDGKTTTVASNDVCQRANGAPSAVQADGPSGIDNSFGANFVPLIQSLTGNPDISFTGTTQIQKGKASTSLFAIDGSGIGTAKTRLYAGLPLGAAPTFDGTDRWPIADESVIDGDRAQPAVAFPKATLDGTTFDTGPNATGPNGWVLIQIDTAVMRLPIRKLRFHGKVNGDVIGDGIISGVVKTEELVTEMKRILGTASSSFCSAFDGIAAQIKQMQDVLDDGTQDPGKPCNAISIGLGFEAKRIRLGDVKPTPPAPNTCP
jgi:hypothetical protein